jgi:hypothetical protein
MASAGRFLPFGPSGILTSLRFADHLSELFCKASSRHLLVGEAFALQLLFDFVNRIACARFGKLKCAFQGRDVGVHTAKHTGHIVVWTAELARIKFQTDTTGIAK